MGIRTLGVLAASLIMAGLAVAAAPDGASRAPEPPDGMHFVGLGHVVVAVPDAWGVNEMLCGEPTRDTALVDVVTVGLCGWTRGPKVESVLMDEGERRYAHRADELVTIDGVGAERGGVTCHVQFLDALDPDPPGLPTICAGSLYFPDRKIGVYAASSTSAATVEEILARVRVLPGVAGVPESEQLIAEERERSGEAYLRRLRAYGLIAKVVEGDRRDAPAGQLLSVLPRTATVLRPGDQVTVFVNAPGGGPAAVN